MRRARSASRTRRQRIGFARGQYCPRHLPNACELTNVRQLSIVRLMSDIAATLPRGSYHEEFQLGYDLDAAMVGDLPFVADARSQADLSDPETCSGGFTLRHARIPAELAQEFADRVMEMATEFTRLPRSGNREYAFYFGVFPTNRPVSP